MKECHICKLSFALNEELQEHMKLYHFHQCVQCRRTFKTFRILSLHCDEVHSPFLQARLIRGEKVYGCLECPKSFSNLNDRAKHLMEHNWHPQAALNAILGMDFYSNEWFSGS